MRKQLEPSISANRQQRQWLFVQFMAMPLLDEHVVDRQRMRPQSGVNMQIAIECVKNQGAV